MKYSIGEVSKKFNLSASTLRYYDREDLFPNLERLESSIRSFSDIDLGSLEIIECLKNTGMSIKDIKVFIDWCEQRDATLRERYEMFIDRKRIIDEQMASLKKTLEVIEYKCWYYKTALEAGTEKIHAKANQQDTEEVTS
ncbi:MerR family transcriptional regulator [Clostridium estertheticum]|uniref:MerR family transcriptional regulator n=1 Tax=Clostridium estertheticum TaxID=238834 RepID=UPI001C0AEF43|nr:MerR family transcriptional regulator [Clostridium estertheticum]MBU3074832.1 MerR family transcriptional regulator [Clostridium estertheticum]MBU3165047.1 MerR family transcriptional regulator [Clostridium estertheticum]